MTPRHIPPRPRHAPPHHSVDTPADEADALTGVITPVLARLGLEFVRMSIKGSRSQPSIVVFADRVGGVTAGECVEAAKALRPALAHHFGPGRTFAVGVSSPGTDRALRTRKDFALIAGRSVVLQVTTEDQTVEEVTGTVVRAEEEGVVLAGTDGTEFLIRYEKASAARLKLPY